MAAMPGRDRKKQLTSELAAPSFPRLPEVTWLEPRRPAGPLPGPRPPEAETVSARPFLTAFQIPLQPLMQAQC